MSLAIGPSDIRDQRWLDERIADIENGVEAVLDIARNWTEGRNLARLHPGVSAAAYVTSKVGTLGKSVVPVLLAESNWSNRQIATVAGIGTRTVDRIATAPNGAVDRPEKTLGADGRYRPAPITIIEPALPMHHERTSEYKALMDALRVVVEMKPYLEAVYAGVNQTQMQRLQRLAREAAKVIEDVLIPMDVLVIEKE